jgi:hypothetical protein
LACEEDETMDERILDELRDPAYWSNAEAEIRQPTKSPRAVVSVAFSHEDHAQVVERAKALGMKTSEFIRRAALDQLRPSTPQAGQQGGVRAIRVKVGNESTNGFHVTETGVAAGGRGVEVEVELEPAPLLMSNS